MKVAPTLEQEIRALEEKLLKPQVRRSRRELELLLADDFREFGSSGRAYGKREAVDHLQVQAEQRFVMEDFQARAGPVSQSPAHRRQVNDVDLDYGRYRLHRVGDRSPASGAR
jgi:hypothetical protein